MTEPTTEELVDRLHPAPLTIIIEWFKALPKSARGGMSLKNLHDLSKQFDASQAQRLSDLEGKLGEARKALADQARANAKLASVIRQTWRGVWQCDKYDAEDSFLRAMRRTGLAKTKDAKGGGTTWSLNLPGPRKDASEALKLTASGGGEDNSLSQGAVDARDSARPETQHSAGDEVAWLIEETWSGHIHYVHRDFNCAEWAAECRRDRDRNAIGLRSLMRVPLVTKDIDEAMRFPTKDAAELWLSFQPRWMNHGDQYQVREHMWVSR